MSEGACSALRHSFSRSLRPSGERGSRGTEEYRVGAQYLLLLRDGAGFSPLYWWPLGPVNEQLRGTTTCGSSGSARMPRHGNHPIIDLAHQYMNSRKLDVLNTLDNAARVHDESLARSFDIVRNPEQFGWRKSILTAAVVVPLTGISAVLTDLSRVMVARSDDEAWNRQLPPTTEPGPDVSDTSPDSLGG